MAKAPIEILIDTREQRPYLFNTITPLPPITHIVTLKTGDYSLKGFKDKIAIERKSLTDAFGTFGRGRSRFVRELLRMTEYDFAAVIIEADWTNIIRNPPARSKLNPKTIHASVVAWQIRYGIHFWCVPNRAFGEKTTYRLLERFYNDHKRGLANGKNAESSQN